MLQPTDYSNTVKRLDECIELRGKGGGGYKAVPEKNSFVKPNEMGKIRKPMEYNDISDIWCPFIGKRKKQGYM